MSRRTAVGSSRSDVSATIFAADQYQQTRDILTNSSIRCSGCHTLSLYTNNILVPLDGFEPPADHLRRLEVRKKRPAPIRVNSPPEWYVV